MNEIHNVRAGHFSDELFCFGTALCTLWYARQNKLVVHKNQEKRADNCNTKKIHDAEEEERAKLAE